LTPLSFFVRASYVKNVIAADQHLAQRSCRDTVNKFFCVSELIGVNNKQTFVSPQVLLSRAHRFRRVRYTLSKTVSYLQVHVGIDRDQETLVLLSPLQLDQDGLSCEIVKEGLGVDGYELRYKGA
jgi:hypothetical protein